MTTLTQLREKAQSAYNFLTRRKRAYISCFCNPTGDEVLRDLAQFCRAGRTCFDPDPRVHAALEGRREVWLRIQQHIGLTNAQAFSLFSGNAVVDLSEDD